MYYYDFSLARHHFACAAATLWRPSVSHSIRLYNPASGGGVEIFEGRGMMVRSEWGCAKQVRYVAGISFNEITIQRSHCMIRPFLLFIMAWHNDESSPVWWRTCPALGMLLSFLLGEWFLCYSNVPDIVIHLNGGPSCGKENLSFSSFSPGDVHVLLLCPREGLLMLLIFPLPYHQNRILYNI